ncbi:histone acetyltransferase p300-like [Heterocephalus glaber]|uniref:histone acetyltransferase n=1 Tax=Heterocephalus glaber TaxID=10181 RepID=A0AAX6P7G7_HETGA|nr:histone acetyltransferase p300-like [Heterocephalus glaber]
MSSSPSEETSAWSSLQADEPNDSIYRFVYTCTECKEQVDTHWRCTVCQEYILCVSCYPTKNHDHPMEKLGLGLDDESSKQQIGAAQNPGESCCLSIQRNIQSLLHACQCRNANCSLPSCKKMKRVIQHTKGCKRKNSAGCAVCKQLVALCWYHARNCPEDDRCFVPYCFTIKQKLQQPQLQLRIQQALMLRRMTASTDPDPLVPCDLNDAQDAGTSARSSFHSEPSGPPPVLRRSTTRNVPYICSECRQEVETRWRCTVCQEYVLCVPCYYTKNHDHKMEKVGPGIDGESSNQQGAAIQNPRDIHRQRIQRSIQSLIHARQCRDSTCSMPTCKKMKRVVEHTKNCRRKAIGGCPVCRQLIALCCYHAKRCQENNCPVPFCFRIKQKLRQQRLQRQRSRMVRRRMASM